MMMDELIIDEGLTTFEAMQQLDKAGRRIVFIAPEGRLKAVLTDSDIRKYILRGGDLSAPVSSVANPQPKWLPAGRKQEAKAFMADNIIDAVPLLDDEGRMVEVVFAGALGDKLPAKPLEMPVVVMAGGLGTRLYPYTKILPKPLIPIGEVPIIELVIDRFNGAGCRDFHLIVNYRKNMIKSYFYDIDHPYNLHWVEEEKPLGTGGGLSLLKGRVNEAFFLTNCDILIDADYHEIADFHKKSGNDITMVCATKQFTIPYGVVELQENGELAAIQEKPSMNFLTNTGMYVVEAGVLQQVEDDVYQGFPDIIQRCREAGGRVGVYPISEANWMDMGQMEELDAMRRRFENNPT